jgi:kynurenine formamidase
MRTRLGFAVLLAAAVAVAQDRPGTPPSPSRVLDLGHPLAEGDPTWTGEKAFTYTRLTSIERDGIFSGRFETADHFGTHLDAPAHFARDGWTVDRIPADRLVRRAVCVNVAGQAARDEDYRVTLNDVREFERRHGAIPNGALVLIATGWDARWSDAAQYRNERNGVKHFPGLTVEAAAYLARERKVAGIAIDTPSVDYGPSTQFEVHRTTQPLNVYHVENGANLTALPPRGVTVVVAPINLAGGSGGPARMFALLP